MVIKKIETIELSDREQLVLDNALTIANAIYSEATDPHLYKAANTLINAIIDICKYIPEEEEEDYE